MKIEIEKIFKKVLVWLPSAIITVFFITHAINKILPPDQQDKIVSNDSLKVIIGIILIIATALFLYNDTMIVGTAILATSMTFKVFIHMYEGNSFEVAILIVMATIFAAYIRKPRLFHERHKP